MADRCDRSPWLLGNHRSNRENVVRESRREQSMEGSRLPTFRRSKSVASLSVSSLKGKQPVQPRSSSSSRNMQPQHLFPPSTQKRQSQRAGSSAFSNKFVTPLGQQRMSRTSGSAIRFSSNSNTSPWLKQSGNKEIQKKELSKEFNRIRQVLTTINCDTQLSKSLTIRDFVNILIYIFNFCDIARIDSPVTIVNYVTVVPNIMKVLQYNGNISAAFLKSMNTMHNWPHVVNILSFLCDLVEAQSRSDPEFINSSNTEITLLRRTACRSIFANESDQRKLKSELTKTILQIRGVNLQELDMRRKKAASVLEEIEIERENFKKIQTEHQMRKSQAEDLQIKMDQLINDKESTESEYDLKMKSTAKQIQELVDRDLPAASEKKCLLEEQLKIQTCSKEDLFQLQYEIKDCEETRQLLEERKQNLDTDWNHDFVELCKTSGKLKAAAIKFNDRLKSMYPDNTDVNRIFVPESGFSQFSKEHFESILSECTSSSIHERISNLKENLIESEKECDMNLCIMEDLKREVSRIKSKNNHKFKLLTRKRQEFVQVWESLEKKLESIREETLSWIEKIDKLHKEITYYEELIVKVDKKNVELEEIRETNIKTAHEVLNKTLLDMVKCLKNYEESKCAYLLEYEDIEKKVDDLRKAFT